MHNRTTKCRRNHQSHDNITGKKNKKLNNSSTHTDGKNRIPKEKLQSSNFVIVAVAVILFF